MKKIDPPPPTFLIAALWDLLLQQSKYLQIMWCSLCAFETLPFPMIIINNLKPPKAESREDGHPKTKRRMFQLQRFKPF